MFNLHLSPIHSPLVTFTVAQIHKQTTRRQCIMQPEQLLFIPHVRSPISEERVLPSPALAQLQVHRVAQTIQTNPFSFPFHSCLIVD